MEKRSAHNPNTDRHGASRKGKLLLVDDDLNHLRHYTTVLDALGYDVKPFSSYGDAVACLEHELFDMVVVKPGNIHI